MVWTVTARAAILNLSELSLYEFSSEELIPRYWTSQLIIAYKGLDSFSYFIENLDLYKEMASSKHYRDLSDHPQDYSMHDLTYKTVPLKKND